MNLNDLPTDEEVAAMSAEELARFGYELRMAELERRHQRAQQLNDRWFTGALVVILLLTAVTVALFH